MTEPTDRLRGYGEEIASAVSPARSRVAAMRAIGKIERSRPRHVFRISFAGLGVFVVANVISAGVADAAVPGDSLYALDRGYERAAAWMGLGGDHTQERIDEARVLVSRSDLTGALDLVAEAVEDEAVQEAVTILQATDRSDPDLPDHVEDLVAGVHEWVDARQAGAEDVAEAAAWVRLLAIQINQQARQSDADRTGPPDHAQGEGRPEVPAEQSQVPAEPPQQDRPEQAGQQGPPDQPEQQDEGSGRDGASGDPGPPGPPASDESPGATNPGRGNRSSGAADDNPAGSGPPGPPADDDGSAGRGGGRP